MMKNVVVFLNKQRVISIATIVFVVLALLVIILDYVCGYRLVKRFFGAEKSPSEVFKYIGVVSGSIVLIGNLYANNRRNQVTEKGQLDIRFKDAATLLASDNTSANLSGIYALHQIATEAYHDGNKGYVKVIHEILCAFVRENSDVSNPEEPKNTKADIVIQTIVDVLFNRDGQVKNIYEEHLTDLRRCYFNDILFSKGVLNNIIFTRTIFSECWFKDAKITQCWFDGAKLTKCQFNDAKLTECSFYKTNFTYFCFNNAKKLENCTFSDSTIKDIPDKEHLYQEIIEKAHGGLTFEAIEN